jgi:drug/metabolite transporter (DMT)-like permease
MLDITINNLVWYFVCATSASFPIVLIKKYVENNDFSLLIYSMMASAIMVFSYIKILKNNKISLLYPFLKVFSVFIVLFFGFVFNGETLSLHNIFGIMLGCVSIYLLNHN